MSVLALLIPTSILLGLVGLGAFLWSMRNGQYDDLRGAAERVLQEDDQPLPPDAGKASGAEESDRQV